MLGIKSDGMRYTATSMGDHIRAQAEGRLSVSAYCKAHHLSPSRFYYWRKKLSGGVDLGEEPRGFTEIRPVEEPHRRSLYLPSGLCIELAGLSIAELAELIVQIDRAHA